MVKINCIRLKPEYPKVFVNGIFRRNSCYEGCIRINSHLARLCDKFTDYHNKCSTNKHVRMDK